MSDGWTGQKGFGPWSGRNVLFANPAYPGAVVKHCQHPTANYPWFTYSCDGELRTFRTLAEAKAYVADEYSKTEVGCMQMIAKEEGR